MPSNARVARLLAWIVLTAAVAGAQSPVDLQLDDVFTPPAHGRAEAGDTVTYTVTLRNNSPDAIANIVIRSVIDAFSTLVEGSSTFSPLAVDDAGYEVDPGVTLTVGAGPTGLVANDTLGNPSATVTHFGGGTLGGMVTDHAPGDTATVAGGTLRINNPGGSFTFTSAPDFSGFFRFNYRLTNAIGTADAEVVIAVGSPASARNDDLEAIGNTRLTLATGGLFADHGHGQDGGSALRVTAVNGDPANVGVAAPTSQSVDGAHFGQATVTAAGGLVYDPPPGFVGDDTFTYTIENAVGDASVATVTITLADLIWYLDSQAATAGLGTQFAPFMALESMSTSFVAESQTIFLAGGGPAYTGNLRLLGEQRMIGQGATESFEAITGLTAPPGVTLPMTGGVRPVIHGTPGGGLFTLYLASGSQVHGLDLGSAAAEVSTVGLYGSSITGSTVKDVTIRYPAGSNAITLYGCQGTFLFERVAVNSGANSGIMVQQGGPEVTFKGDLNQTGGGPAIHLASTTGGSLRMSEGTVSVTDAQYGVFAQSGTFDLTIESPLRLSGGTAFRSSEFSGAWRIPDMIASIDGDGRGIDLSGGALQLTVGGSLTYTGTDLAVLVSSLTGVGALDLSALDLTATGDCDGVQVQLTDRPVSFGQVHLGTSDPGGALSGYSGFYLASYLGACSIADARIFTDGTSALLSDAECDLALGGGELHSVDETALRLDGVTLSDGAGGPARLDAITSQGSDGLRLTNCHGALAVSGATRVTAVSAGLDLGGSDLDATFGELEIDFRNGNGLDLTGFAGRFTSGDTAITGQGNQAGVKLLQATNPNPSPMTPNILIGAAPGQFAQITNVQTGVQVGDTPAGEAGAYLKFGDQALPPGRSSIDVVGGGRTIDTNALTSVDGYTEGRYEFEQVTFGDGDLATFQVNADLLFAGSEAAGQGTGTSVSNRLDGNALLSVNTTGKKIVLVNDGAPIDLRDSQLSLGNGAQLVSFGNGRTVTPFMVPPNVIVTLDGTVTDPFGHGAAVLTSSSLGATLSGGDGLLVADVIIENTSTYGTALSTQSTGLTVADCELRLPNGAGPLTANGARGVVSITDTSWTGDPGTLQILLGDADYQFTKGTAASFACGMLYVTDTQGGSLTADGLAVTKTGVRLHQNATSIHLTDLEIHREASPRIVNGVEIDRQGPSTGSVVIDGASTLDDSPQGRAVFIGPGSRDIDLRVLDLTDNGSPAGVVEIDGQSGGAIQLGELTSAGGSAYPAVRVNSQSSGALTFGATRITQFTAASPVFAVDLAGTGGQVTFADLDVTMASGSALSTGAISLDPGVSPSLVIDPASAGQAISSDGTTFTGDRTFSDVSAQGDSVLIGLTDCHGGLTIGGGLLKDAGSALLRVTGGDVDLTWHGDGQDALPAALLSVTGGHTGSLLCETGSLSTTYGYGLDFGDADGSYTFRGSLTCTSAFAGGLPGIRVGGNSSGTFTFEGPVSIDSGDTQAVDITADPTALVSFRDDVIIQTTTGLGFGMATGQLAIENGAGDDVTIDSTGGQALKLIGTELVNGGVSFDHLNSGGGAHGVQLEVLTLTDDFFCGAATLANHTATTLLVRDVTGGAGSMNFEGVTDLDADATGDGLTVIGTSRPLNVATLAGSALTIDGGAWGLSITNATGTLRFGAGPGAATIGGTATTAGPAIQCSGGSPTVVFEGNLTNSAGRALIVNGTTGGSVAVQEEPGGAPETFTDTAGGILIDGCAGDVTLAPSSGLLTGGGLFVQAQIADSTGALRFDNLTLTDTTSENLGLGGFGDGHNLGGSVAFHNVDVTRTAGGPPMNAILFAGQGDATVDFDADCTVQTSGAQEGIYTALNSGARAIAFHGPVDLGLPGDPLTVGSYALNHTDSGGQASLSFADLDIETVGGRGISGVGGTLTVLDGGDGNQVNVVNGAAVVLSNTTVGPAGMTFQQLNASGSNQGLALNNTGNGPFTVTGDGATSGGVLARNQSGGVISTTGFSSPVTLTDARHVTLRQMTVQNPDTHVIKTSGGGDFTFSALDLQPVAGAAWDATDPGGTNRWDEGCRFQTAGPISSSYFEIETSLPGPAVVAIDQCTFAGHASQSAVALRASAAAQIDLQVTDSSPLNATPMLFDAAGQQAIQASYGNSAGSTARGLVTVSDAIFENSTGSDGNGVSLYAVNNGEVRCDIHDNTFRNQAGSGEQVFVGAPFGGGTVGPLSGANARIRDNTFQNCNGTTLIRASTSNSTGSHNLIIENNTVLGGQTNAAVSLDSDSCTAGELDVRVTGNTLGTAADPLNGLGVWVIPASAAPINLECTDNHTVSSYVTGDAFFGGTRGGAANLTFRQNTWQNLVDDTHVFSLYASDPSDAICVDLDGDDALSTAGASGGGTFSLVQGGAATMDLVDKTTVAARNTGTVALSGTIGDVASCPTPSLLSAARLAPAKQVASLDETDLAPVLAAATDRSPAGAAPEVSLTELRGTALASTFVGQVQLDPTAAGWGWFVDPTPLADEEFAPRGGLLLPFGTSTELLARAGGPAAGKMDLLTVLLHELGHAAGLDHAGAGDLMAPTLDIGLRRVPAGSDRATVLEGAEWSGLKGLFQRGGQRQVAKLSRALPAPSAGTGVGQAGNPLTYNVAVLPPGAEVTFQYQVTIDADIVHRELTSQATVTADGLAEQDSDDPDTAEANDATITPVELAASAALSTATVPDGLVGVPDVIAIQVVDVGGFAKTIGGDDVAVTVTGANPATAAVTDHADGTYDATYPLAQAGADEVVILLNGTALAGSPFSRTIDPGVVDPDQSTVTLDPDRAAADGVSEVLGTLTLRDAFGNPIPDMPVDRIQISGEPAGLTVTGPAAPTNGDGRTAFALTSASAVSYTVSIEAGDVPLTTRPTAIFRSFFRFTIPAGLGLYGLPFQPDRARPEDIVGPDAVGRLATWTEPPGGFVRYQPSDPSPLFDIVAGKGFWVRVDAPTEVNVLGEPTPVAPFEFALNHGFTLLGNPFDQPLRWDPGTIEVHQDGALLGMLSQPELWTKVRPYVWVYDREAGAHWLVMHDFGRPNVGLFDGFWAIADEPGIRLVVPPSHPGRSRARQVAASRWTVTLNASAPAQAPSAVTVGVDHGLQRALAIEAPPEPDGAPPVALQVVAGDRLLAGELRTAGRDQVWELLLTSALDGDVTLSWPSLLRDLPRGLLVELQDLGSEQRWLVNTRSSVALPMTRGSQRRLRLTTRFGNLQRSSITSLQLRGSRGGGQTVELQLTGPARVTLVVRGLAGRLVRTITAQAAAAGPLQLSWDGQDGAGRPVPRGSYLLEAVAESDNGATMRVTRTITVQ